MRGEVFRSYAVRLGGCHLLLASPQSVLDVLRSLELSADHARRLGLSPPARVRHLLHLLQRELEEYQALHPSADGSAEVPRASVLAPSPTRDQVDVAGAARMLEVTPRQVRNLSEQL